MEGITIASVNDNSVRSHIFSASVGIAYDTAYTDYNCPPLNCGMDDSTYCVGPYAPVRCSPVLCYEYSVLPGDATFG